MGDSLTNRQLEDALNNALDRIRAFSSKYDTLESKYAEVLDVIKKL